MSMFDKLLNAQPEPEQPTDIIMLANNFTVKTDADYEKATEFCKQIKAAKDDINAKWEPLVKKAHESHKALKEQQNAAVKPLEAAISYLKGQMDSFYMEKERKRIEAERKIREEQEAERRRLQEEADKARAAGNERAAQAAEDAAASMPVASVQSAAPKVEGVSFVTEYDAEIVDDGAVPVTFNGAMLRPVDMALVRALAKAHKGKLVIPGIRISEIKKSRVRA